MKKTTLILAVVLVGIVLYFNSTCAGQENIVMTATGSGWGSQNFHNELAKLVVGDIDLSTECWTES